MSSIPSRRPGPQLSILPPPRRVADVVVDTLRDLGVRMFFGVPGGTITPIYEALARQPDALLINNRHETAAMFMAGGAAQHGQIPVVLVGSGAGVTNVVTGLANAFADGFPVIVLAGDVAHQANDKRWAQPGAKLALDLVGLVRPVAKYVNTVTNPRSASSVVRRALQTALSGRQGPVFLALPQDVMNEEVIPTTMSAMVGTSFQLDEALLDRAAMALQGCRRGLIMVGSGARHMLAVTQVRILSEMLQIPVCTTPKGKGLFPERSPHSLGVLGHGGHPSAARYIEGGIDVLLAVGCGFGDQAIPGLAPTHTFIQIDIDGSQIGKNHQVDVGLVGAAHQVLPALTARLAPHPVSLGATRRLEQLQPELATHTSTPLHPARVVALLQELWPRDTIFTADVGEDLAYAIHYLQVDQPDGFLVNTGLGATGSGINAAIGAKLAKPDRPVLAITGDTGMQMYGMELATCVQHEIGVTFAVFNHESLPRIDFAVQARGAGAEGHVIRTAEDLLALTVEQRDRKKPLVLDIRTDPKARFPPSHF